MNRFSRLIVACGLLLFLGTETVLAQNIRALPDFTDLVEKQGATVVNISTTQRVNARRNDPFSGALPFEEGDPRLEFFRRFFPRPPSNTAPRELESHSLGSGFIITSDGYILTNAHVVEGADEITVRLTDKREFSGRIGADKRTDVALLKIEASALPTAKIGDPQQLRPGEWVLAIGSPFGFESSVTAGIVSAKGRALPQENYVPFIQTDVAINPGNSGGPLFNMRGEVVGINSQIYSRSGGYMGVSFAIPMDVAMEIQSQLRKNGKVNRGRIGVMIQEIGKEVAESLGFSQAAGVLVGSVDKQGPADKAGIEPGDIILKYDGRTLSSSSDLPRWVAATKPGSKAVLQVWRKGTVRDITVTIGEMQEDKQTANSAGSKPSDRSPNRLGLVLRELTADQRNELKLNGGLLIEDVRNLQGRADLRAGDILLALANKGVLTEVKTVEQLNKLLSQYEKSANVTVLIRRGAIQTFVVIKGNNGN